MQLGYSNISDGTGKPQVRYTYLKRGVKLLFKKNYEVIRRILKDIYIFGCYTEDECLKRMGISKSEYDKRTAEIGRYIEEDKQKSVSKGHKKIKGFYYDRYNINDNYFVNSYKLKACNDKQLIYMIYIFQILGDNKARTFNEIIREIEKLPNCPDIEEQSVIRVCNRLANTGCIEKKYDGIRNIYRRTPCPLEDLEENELKLLFYLSDLYSVKSAYNIPAIFLKESIVEYMRGKNIHINTDESIFIYEYNFMHRIFNDIIIADLIDAAENKKLVEITPYNGKAITVLPVKIVSEYQYGRQFVLGVDINKEKPVSCHIEFIKSVKLMDKCDADTAGVIEYFEKSWCISDYKSDENRISERVEIDFYVDENERDILYALDNEKRWGQLERLDSEQGRVHLLYTIDVNDCIEMKPWIRKFGGRAVVRKSSCHTLAEDIAEEWKELLEHGYGIVPGK